MSNPPTAEHLQRAFEQLRRADWPATLAELHQRARQAALVQGLAQRLANGQGMSLPEHPGALADYATPPAALPLRRSDWPPRSAHPVPRGRRSSDGPDLKRIAAGDRDDD